MPDLFWRACALTIVGLVVAIVCAATGNAGAAVGALGFTSASATVAVMTV